RRGEDDDADRPAGEPAQPLDHAGVEAVAREPAGLVLSDPLFTHAVELGRDRLARAAEVGEPRVGAPVPRERRRGRPRAQRVDQHRHLPAALHERAEPRDQVVRDLEEAYSRMLDLRAEFTQTAFNKSLNQTIPAEGTVYLKKGGKLRWEYKEPTPQAIVSDGKKLWVYTPALNQVNV